MVHGFIGKTLLIILCMGIFSLGCWLLSFQEEERGLHYEGEKQCDSCHTGKMEGAMELIHPEDHSFLPEFYEGICKGGIESWALMLDSASRDHIFSGCDTCHRDKAALETAGDAGQEGCLFCHAKRYEVFPKPGGFEAQPACLACHELDVSETLLAADLTLAHEEEDLTGEDGCFDCHYSLSHRETGDEVVAGFSSCSANNCHAEAPHARARIDEHLEILACETCHIPVTTALNRDWTRPVWDEATQKYVPTRTEERTRPKYGWWEQGDAPHRFASGAQGRMISRVVPFRPLSLTFPIDAEGTMPGTLERPRFLVFDKNVYAVTGDLTRAIEAGMAETGLPFSGKWAARTLELETGVRLTHGIVKEALDCVDCHQEGLSLDFRGIFSDDTFLNRFEKAPAMKFAGGPLWNEHAELEEDCSSCHGDWRTGSTAVGCTTAGCHPEEVAAHTEQEADCAFCHGEHLGDLFAVDQQKSSGTCLKCHERTYAGKITTWLADGSLRLPPKRKKIETGLIFSHLEHAEEIEDQREYRDCTACHQPLEGGEHFAMPSHQGETGCYGNGNCHKFAKELDNIQGGEDCLECHIREDGTMNLGPAIEAKIQFSHEQHTEGEHRTSCRKCHKELKKDEEYTNIEKKTGAYLQSMQSCVGCHHREETASADCLSCHTYHHKEKTGDSREPNGLPE